MKTNRFTRAIYLLTFADKFVTKNLGIYIKILNLQHIAQHKTGACCFGCVTVHAWVVRARPEQLARRAWRQQQEGRLACLYFDSKQEGWEATKDI
jgi:hypothetical protein